ncbi:uncharacterized protein [Epargyreus clarus]|uniref:uncharacterized protein n=1 Tax=Epargyreus clarus TaxID=520877 RepID=UPI003C3027D4
MAVFIVVIAALCVAVSAAPPAQPRHYAHNSAQAQQIHPLDFYLDNQEVDSYYNEAQQKQVNANTESEGAPSRLETLDTEVDPQSEVETIPGFQPAQPPQQTPVAPNIPGLLPGRRVFVIHMPVPGYRPGTIGGYQPLYVVAAAPEQKFYTPNGFEVPSGAYPQYLGYPRPGLGLQGVQGNPNFVIGGAPLTLNRPYNLVYQEPVVAYQPVAPGQGAHENSVRLSQLVTLQQQAGHGARPESDAPANPELKKANLESSATKEAEEPRRNARPAPPHANRSNV